MKAWAGVCILSLLCVGCLERRPATAPPLTGLRPIDPDLPVGAPGPAPPPAPPPSTDAPPPGVGARPASVQVPAGPSATVPPGVAAAQARVKPVLDRLLAGTPNLGLRPSFLITDQADLVVQRREFERVFVSEGLVNSCATEGQLAALLAWQLGELAAERRAELNASLAGRNREPPPTVPMRREDGMYGNPDRIHLAEIATLGLDRRDLRPQPPLDPWLVARETLVRAGYSEQDLQSLQPILKAMGAPAPR